MSWIVITDLSRNEPVLLLLLYGHPPPPPPPLRDFFRVLSSSSTTVGLDFFRPSSRQASLMAA